MDNTEREKIRGRQSDSMDVAGVCAAYHDRTALLAEVDELLVQCEEAATARDKWKAEHDAMHREMHVQRVRADVAEARAEKLAEVAEAAHGARRGGAM